MLTLVLVPGCRPQRRQWEVPASTLTAQSPIFALVPRTAPLHVAPDPSAPAIVIAPVEEGALAGARELAAFRVRGERQGWVELETLGEPAVAHCAPDVPSLYGLRLRLFTPSRALAPVTIRDVEQRFADGTSITLRRGTPLEPLPRAPMLFRAADEGLGVVLRLAAHDVGTRYLDSAAFETRPTTHTLPSEVIAAGVPIVSEGARLEASDPRARPVYRGRASPRGDLIAELHTRCMRLEVRVPMHVVQERAIEVATSESVAPVGPPLVPSGTALLWPNGVEAGRTSAPIALGALASSGASQEPQGELRCFVRALREGDDPTGRLELCVRRRDVIDPEAGAGGALDAPD